MKNIFLGLDLKILKEKFFTLQKTYAMKFIFTKRENNEM